VFRPPPRLRRRVLGALAALVPWTGDVAAATDPGVDFHVASIEVTQGIQSGSTPLVAGRSTLVRAAIGLDGPPTAVDDGVEASFSPVYSTNGPFPAAARPDREVLDGTLNFVFLPPESEDVVLTVVVNPAGPEHVPEVDPGDNALSKGPLAFRARRAPELAWVPLDHRPAGEAEPNLPDPELVRPGVGDNFVHAAFPAPDWHYHRSDAPSKHWEGPIGNGALLSSLAADLELTLPRPDFLYAWVPGGLASNGSAILNGAVAYGNTEAVRSQRTLAHELGHNLGLVHQSLFVGSTGVDVEHHLLVTEGLGQVKDRLLFDLMLPGSTTAQAWIHPWTYQSLAAHAVFDATEPLAAPTDGPVLMVRGTWDDATGSADVAGVLRFDGGTPSRGVARADADVLVRAFAGGELLAELPLAARRSGGPCGAVETDREPAVFTAVLALDPAREVDRLELAGARPGAPARVVRRSPSAPQVVLAGPRAEVHAGEPVGRRVTVEWEARDADGDELGSWLVYRARSRDGRAWRVPLASGGARARRSVDLAELPRPSGGEAWLEVLVSDGLRTAHARSAPLALADAGSEPGSAPWVDVLTPDAGKHFPRGATVVLHGSAWDLEDRALDGASLVWTSDVDGEVGTGRLTSTAELSVGAHVLTLRATDSDGRVASAATSIVVGPRLLPGEVCQADLGSGGPGAATLALCGGDLSSGTSADLVLAGAPAGQLGWLVGGPAADPTPLWGGMLVPLPAALLVPLVTGADGGVRVDGLEGGGGPLVLYLQAVCLDPAQAEGAVLSNALRVEFLP